jgi:hypothetical protein
MASGQEYGRRLLSYGYIMTMIMMTMIIVEMTNIENNRPSVSLVQTILPTALDKERFLLTL